MNRQSLRMQHMTVVLFHPRNAFEDHYHRAPFSAHVDGFKGSIQY